MAKYRYVKRTDWDDENEVWMLFREQPGKLLSTEMWEIDSWVNGIDWWWQIRQEFNYHDISKAEAMAIIPTLTARQLGMKKSKQEAAERAAQQKETDRLNELARRMELDDWTPLERAALAMHEVFMTLQKAGFTEKQALAVVVGSLRDSQRREDHNSTR